MKTLDTIIASKLEKVNWASRHPNLTKIVIWHSNSSQTGEWGGEWGISLFCL